MKIRSSKKRNFTAIAQMRHKANEKLRALLKDMIGVAVLHQELTGEQIESYVSEIESIWITFCKANDLIPELHPEFRRVWEEYKNEATRRIEVAKNTPTPISNF